MSLFDFFKNNKSKKSTSSGGEEVVYFDSFGRVIGRGGKGFKLGEENTQPPSFYEITNKAYGQSPWVYIIVDRIAKACMDLAQNHLQLLNMEGEPISTQMKRVGKVRELERLLMNPQEQLNGFSLPMLVYTTISNYLLTGNGYMMGFPYNSEEPQRYNNIIAPLAQNVDPDDNSTAKVNSYTVSYYSSSFNPIARDVMHMFLPNITYDYNEGHASMQSLVNIWKANNALNANEQYTHERKGSHGVFYSKGTRPLPPNERKSIQEQMDKDINASTRVGKYYYSPTEMGYIDLAKSFKDLQASESKDDHRETVAAAYNYPVQLLNDTSSTRDSNMSQVDKMVYKKAILPVFDLWLNFFNDWLLVKNYQLSTVKLGYKVEDIPEMNIINSDKTENNSQKLDMVLRVNESVSNGITTSEVGLNMLVMAGFSEDEAERLVVSVQDETFNQNQDLNTTLEAENVNAEAQASLRGSVGGVQGILAIQESVANGITDYNAAIETLMLIYGFSNEEAVSILGNPDNIRRQDNEEE
jgi:phage portal protein BeeE